MPFRISLKLVCHCRLSIIVMFRLTEVSEQALVLIHFLAGRGLRLIRARSIHNGPKYLLKGYRVGFRQKDQINGISRPIQLYWYFYLIPDKADMVANLKLL